MVSCSLMLVRINLDINQHLISMISTINESTNRVTSSITLERSMPGKSNGDIAVVGYTVFSEVITKKNIAETCGLRAEKSLAK